MNGKDEDPTLSSMALNPAGDDTPLEDAPDSFAPIDAPAPGDPPPAPETLEATEDEGDDSEDEELPKKTEPGWEVKTVSKLRKQRTEAREQAKALAAEKEALAAEKAALAVELALLKAEREDPEPDPADDPQAYKEWAKRDAARKLQVPAKPDPAKELTKPAEPTKLDKQVEAAREKYDDYNRFVSLAVQKKIETDPALFDRVWGSKNPAEEAYQVGRELILGKDKAPPPRLSSGGGFGGGSRGAATLSAEERRVAKIFGVEKEVEQRRAARGGR